MSSNSCGVRMSSDLGHLGAKLTNRAQRVSCHANPDVYAGDSPAVSETPQPQPPESAAKPLPYTYFRADGLSLDRVESAAAAKREFEKMKKELCKRFGAGEVMYNMPEGSRHATVRSFYFAPAQEKNVPAHWESKRQTGIDGELQAIFAQPPAGSPDAFFLADYAGLMTRALRRMKIENLFGCDEMPMKEMPAGTYSGSFVRDRNVETQGAAGERMVGQIRDNVTFCFGSNSACRASDPIDVVLMMEAWYIRVPNDAEGKPRFTPPDAVEVPLAEMMKIDREERAAQSDRARMASFNPGI